MKEFSELLAFLVIAAILAGFFFLALWTQGVI
jgi:hypothetical protein